ncbi:MAG: hypothetical protein QOI06_1519 [Nocardioidaceae bacterium]|jgi:hypothetical protein|nr:hypothetical protein [Nocardioidaceae bacterium]
MPEWVTPVLAALIAAAAVMVTNLLNARSSAQQREDDRVERAADRDHEMNKWKAEREAARHQWLLDRRAEAYLALWEWCFLDQQDPKKAQTSWGIDVRLRAYASRPVADAYIVWWSDPDSATGEDDPKWQELVKLMRNDLGSNDNPSP